MTVFCHASPAYETYRQVYQKKGLDSLRLAASPTKDYINLIKNVYNLSQADARCLASAFHEAMLWGIAYKNNEGGQEKRELKENMKVTLLKANKFLSEKMPVAFNYQKATDWNLLMLTTKDPNERVKAESEFYSLVFHSPCKQDFKESAIIEYILRYDYQHDKILALSSSNESLLRNRSFGLFSNAKVGKCEY